MPGIGNEQTLQREMTRAMIARKSGDVSIKIVTHGDMEIESTLHHQLHSLPEVDLGKVQNDDGSFAYMAGWDGPQPDGDS